jgi:hypothetical protein
VTTGVLGLVVRSEVQHQTVVVNAQAGADLLGGQGDRNR